MNNELSWKKEIKEMVYVLHSDASDFSCLP